MEKIKKEDLPALLPVKRGRDTRLRTMLMQLEIGEGAFMPATEWKRKNTPYYVLAAIRKKTGKKFEYGMKPDKSGWLFRRVA